MSLSTEADSFENDSTDVITVTVRGVLGEFFRGMVGMLSDGAKT